MKKKLQKVNRERDGHSPACLESDPTLQKRLSSAREANQDIIIFFSLHNNNHYLRQHRRNGRSGRQVTHVAQRRQPIDALSSRVNRFARACFRLLSTHQQCRNQLVVRLDRRKRIDAKQPRKCNFVSLQAIRCTLRESTRWPKKKK